jgi:hypothetical protein
VQDSIRLATSASFVVGNARGNAFFASTNVDWRDYLPEREGTGSCPNCTKSYVCQCFATLYDVAVPFSFCAGLRVEACNKLPEY